MLGDERIGSGTMVAQHTRRTRLVSLHQPAVADHVGREYGGEAAVHRIPRSSLHGVLLAGQSYTGDHWRARRRRSHIDSPEPFGLAGARTGLGHLWTLNDPSLGAGSRSCLYPFAAAVPRTFISVHARGNTSGCRPIAKAAARSR